MKITYFELLEKVIMSNPPKKIKVGTATYTWNGCDYILTTDSRKSLSDTLTSWTTKAQTTAEFIEVFYQILTDEEKEYLRAVIKPYRNSVKYVRKERLCSQREFIRIWFSSDFITLPIHDGGETYKGMIPERGYTLEELGL